MAKLILRFIIICIVFTVLISLIIFHIENIADYKNDLGNIKLLSQGTFYSLDNILKKYPSSRWQEIINKINPSNSVDIKIIPISKLKLPQNQIKEISNNQIVFHEVETENSTTIYKRVNNTAFAYRYVINYTSIEMAHRVFAWPPSLVSHELQKLPPTQWSNYLSEISKHYGYPISVKNIDELNLTENKQETLRKNQWVIYLPDKKDDSVQYLYIPLSFSKKILVFGPITLPLIGTYKKYILFFAALLCIVFIIFIIAILFAKSLEKLKKLANEYGQGHFDSKIRINKTSTLFSLFSNLKLMGEKIQSLISSHKELTHTISHELRTPISRLRFSLELLRDSKNIDEISTRTNAMEEDITELEELVAEILIYAKLDRVEIKPEFKKVSLKSIIDLVIKKFKTDKQLIVDLPFIDHVSTLANTQHIVRALLNILQNANRFAKSIIKLSIIRINILCYQIIIEDDGIGIAEEDKNRIFEPFVQLSDQPKNEKQGYGLGLAITKKILDQHQWNIDVGHSELGGAKFILTINTA